MDRADELRLLVDSENGPRTISTVLPGFDRRYAAVTRPPLMDRRALLCVGARHKNVQVWQGVRTIKSYRQADLEAAAERIRNIFEDADGEEDAEAELATIIAAQEMRTKSLKHVQLATSSTALTIIRRKPASAPGRSAKRTGEPRQPSAIARRLASCSTTSARTA